jgi:hypothetical protein
MTTTIEKVNADGSAIPITTKAQATAFNKKVRAASDRVIRNLTDAADNWRKLSGNAVRGTFRQCGQCGKCGQRGLPGRAGK